MLGLGGQLGINALGAFELGTIQTGAPFVPHRGRVRSALSRAGLTSGLRRASMRSSISSPKIRSEVDDG